MSKLEVLWVPLLLLALIAVESFFLRTTFFPLMHQPLLRRETDLILVLIRPTAEALVSPGILRRRAHQLPTSQPNSGCFTSTLMVFTRTHT